MVRLLILFLSCLITITGCFRHPVATEVVTTGCSNSYFQDSLIRVYIDSGAAKLPGGYNNPAWQLYCDSVLAICPGTAAAYQLKAMPYIKNGEYENAFRLVDSAVVYGPVAYTAYRGFLKCIFTKDYEGAITDFQKAQQLTPNGGEMDHTYKFYEALCNLELGNYAAAETLFNEDIFIQTGGDKTKRPHYNTLLYVGILYYEMKNDPRAKEYLLKCIDYFQKLPEANYYLALVYEREGNNVLKKKYLEIARQSLKEGLTMNEDNLYYANYPHQVTLYEVEAR
jgi:tetratricopeptide (TPR) repeat protein